MSKIYEWNSMSHQLNINCPICQGLATFESAEVVRIKLKKDVPFFQSSKQFDYEMFKDSCGHRWHGAIYFANLHGGSTSAIRDLPEGYDPCNWNHSQYFISCFDCKQGAFICSICNARKKHVLSWPNDAYFSLGYKNQQLWAFNRESTVELRDYIQSKSRNYRAYKWSNFLFHIPAIFKKHNARNTVVKKLNRLLYG